MKLDTPPTRIEQAPFVPPSKALVPRPPWIMRFGKKVQPRVNAIVARHSTIANTPFQDTRQFPWIATLEEHWREIQAEAAEVLQNLDAIPPLAEISPDHRRIAPAGRWRSFFLYGYTYKVEANCARCPRTAALLAKVPGLNSALFSVLVPGTHIPAHTGVTKAILTCHLGIRVPREAEKCRMRVADSSVSWREGQALVFDDTFQHEVLNDTDETRVVLLIQFQRPARLIGRIVGGLFLWGVKHSRFVQEARRGVIAWKAG
jgi:beta-hydroxylase